MLVTFFCHRWLCLQCDAHCQCRRHWEETIALLCVNLLDSTPHSIYHIDVIYLQYSSILRWITPPTFNCSLYCIIIIGLMLRLRAKRTVSMSDSLHKMMPIVGFSLDLRSSWSSASR